MDWTTVKARLGDLIHEPQGRVSDYGEVLELTSSDGGEPIWIVNAGDSVRLDAGWFIRRYVEVDSGLQHLLEVLEALLNGGARELIRLDGGSVTAAGYVITYPGGSLSGGQSEAGPEVLERRLPAWPGRAGTAR